MNFDWRSFLITLLIYFVVFIVLATLVFFTIWGFIHRNRKKSKKHAEAKFIIWSFIIVLFIHLICVNTVAYLSFSCTKESPDWLSFANQGLKEIFALLGGLTFEGQNFEFEKPSDIVECICSIVYFISIAWLAITNAILIVLGFSHTIYSELRVVSLKFKTHYKPTSNMKIYIFPYASKESLILANNIYKDAEKHKNKNDLKKIRIIFSSDELEPFDKDNEIHNEIEQRDYLYIPLPKKDFKKRESVVKNLLGKKIFKKIQNNEVCLFALKTDENEEGFETKNNDIIFDDIDLLLKELITEFQKKSCNKTNDFGNDFLKYCGYDFNNNKFIFDENPLMINYFLLSNHELNFEFYENKLKQTFHNNFSNTKVFKYDSKVPIFNLTVLNEALMTGEDLIKEFIYKNDKDKISTITKDENGSICINYSEGGHKVLVIGFGQTGQKALEHLYLISNGGKLEDDMFVPTQFYVEVIDTNIDEKLSSYIATHPSFIFKEGEIDAELKYEDECFKSLKERYSDYNDFKKIDKYMAFPKVFYKKQNYNEPDFLKTMNDICINKYNSIIIALGNDEQNIKCANSIIQSLRQSINFKNQKEISIFVHIKDHNNELRLNDDHKYFDYNNIEHLSKINIYKFGTLDNIYSTRIFGSEDAKNAYMRYEQTYSKRETNWEYDYIVNNSMYEKKNNESISFFNKTYENFLKALDLGCNINKESFSDKIRKDYTIHYLNSFDEIQDSNNKVYFKFKDKKQNDYINTFKEIGETSEMECKIFINANFANYRRLLIEKKDINSRLDNIELIWRYLIQFEHSRWIRHKIIYGNAYIKEYASSEIEKNEVEKRKFYFKNYSKLHTSLLPYSNLTDFKENYKKENYLEYKAEDYDYQIVLSSLGLDANSKPLLNNDLIKNKKMENSNDK